MRLTPLEIETIKNVIHSFDTDAQIRLFGSRKDDSKKGGDIDLIILSQKLTYSDKLSIRATLKENLGDQKIDIIITKRPTSVFNKMAWDKGVAL